MPRARFTAMKGWSKVQPSSQCPLLHVAWVVPQAVDLQYVLPWHCHATRACEGVRDGSSGNTTLSLGAMGSSTVLKSQLEVNWKCLTDSSGQPAGQTGTPSAHICSRPAEAWKNQTLDILSVTAAARKCVKLDGWSSFKRCTYVSAACRGAPSIHSCRVHAF